MTSNEQIIYQPIFLLFVGISLLLTLGYFWGRRWNRQIMLSALNDLMSIVQPDDQTFTNIGGAIGHHANLFVRRKGAPFSRVDATITLLPRHSWLYLPISKFFRKYDRLFITLYLKQPPREEAHLIENSYSRFMGSKILNAGRLNHETVAWGKLSFHLYFASLSMRDKMLRFIGDNPDPGIVRHIAIVPDQKKGFVFMVPLKEQVARYFAPIYRWMPAASRE
ncbi:MAG: hypothetical protein JW884_08865 [Deltaproteobacteria bacterium]|nr:hypothetical protein [Deltaproteobacteria bacterium]